MALIDTLNVSCRKASELIEQRELRSLGACKRLGLWYHLRICAACKTYEKQSALIDRWLERGRDGKQVIDSFPLEQAVLQRVDKSE